MSINLTPKDAGQRVLSTSSNEIEPGSTVQVDWKCQTQQLRGKFRGSILIAQEEREGESRQHILAAGTPIDLARMVAQLLLWSEQMVDEEGIRLIDLIEVTLASIMAGENLSESDTGVEI